MRLTLSQKLTIIIASVLGVVLLATLATAYQIVSNAETISAERSLAGVAAELATSVDVQTRRQGAALRALGTDSAVRRLLFVDSVDGHQLRAAIRRRLSLDSTTPLRIWNRDGNPLLSAAYNAAVDSAESLGNLPRRGDSTRFGPLYVHHDTALYWVISPILDAAGHRFGWIGERRLIASSPEEQKAIQAFLGGDVAVYFRNDTGSLWLDLAGHRVRAQPTRFQKGVARYSRSTDAGDLLAADADIRNTPWSLVLERPRVAAIAPARAALLRLAAFGLALLFLVTAAVWVISRRFAQPVIDVAGAAQTMATGEYQARVDQRVLTRKDEVGQLARSFNDMASEVQAVHAALEQQVEEARSLNEKLEDVAREADEANHAKSRFVTRMSHELRTPLNAIAGYTELLEMGIHGPINDEQREALARIRHSERALLSLIDDVLGLARLESGQMRYTIGSIDVRSVVNETHSIVAPQLASKAIGFELRGCEAPVGARGDFEKVRRILTNLLSNAIKFTGPHGAISVECRLVEDRVLLEVHDTGIGIPPDRLDVIFAPFVQLRDDLTRTAEGMGLGLAISRDLARGMDGDLSASSQEGKGSVFTLSLPREMTSAERGRSEPPNGAPATRTHEQRSRELREG